MPVADSLTACENTVRKTDPDRYFAILFAPEDKRPLLFALYAFNHELARVGEIVREPMMGEIRLQWWRETLEGARNGKPRAHDVARALAALFVQVDLPASLFDAMIDARVSDFSREGAPEQEALDKYLYATSGNLMRVAARVLGAGDSRDDLAHEAGIAYGLAGLIRSQRPQVARGKHFILDPTAAAVEAQRRFANARRLPKPHAALPAFLPATLVPLYLKNPENDVPLYRKQLAYVSASLRGRI